MSKSLLSKLVYTTALVVLFSIPAPASAEQPGMGGFFAAMGKKDSELSGKVYDKDYFYKQTVSDVRLGMTAEEAQTALTAKGLQGTFGFGDGKFFLGGQTAANGGGTFTNEIDHVTVKVKTYYKADDNTNRVFSVEFEQRFDDLQDENTWKERLKKRYGDEPSREEDYVLYYNNAPILKTGTHVGGNCDTTYHNTAECKNIENRDLSLVAEFPTDHSIKISLIDNATLKAANEALQKQKQDDAKEQTQNQKENF